MFFKFCSSVWRRLRPSEISMDSFWSSSLLSFSFSLFFSICFCNLLCCSSCIALNWSLKVSCEPSSAAILPRSQKRSLKQTPHWGLSTWSALAAAPTLEFAVELCMCAHASTQEPHCHFRSPESQSWTEPPPQALDMPPDCTWHQDAPPYVDMTFACPLSQWLSTLAKHQNLLRGPKIEECLDLSPDPNV